MHMQYEILDAEPLMSAGTPALVALPGTWRYSVAGMLVLVGALGLLAVLADDALGGAVTEMLVASMVTPGGFSK